MHRMTRVVLVVAGIGIMAAGGGCGGGGSGGTAATQPDDQPVPGGKVVVATAQEGDGFNPGSSRLTPSTLNVAKALYDPIAAINEDGVAEPYLVEGIEPNDDFTQWLITTRDDVRFHNGDPLTPEVLATHLKNMQEAPLTFFAFEPVDAVGVLDEAARPRYDAEQISEEEYDLQRRQVVVTMSEPWSTFPAFLAGLQVGFVAHPDYVSGEIEDPVGTGPFRFEEWVPEDHLSAVRNDDYWRPGLPYLDEVEFRPLVDAGSRLATLENGGVDLMITNAPTQVAELSTGEPEDGLRVLPAGGGGDEQVLILNTQSGATADVEVRRALQLATDRQALTDQLYDGFFDIADAPFPPSSPWYAEPGWPEPDPERARQLVDTWESSNGALEIELTVVATQDDLALAQVLAAQWDEVGITTNLDSIAEATLAQRLPNGDFEAIMLQFFPGADPDEHFPFWEPDPANIGGPGEFSINFGRYTSDRTRSALEGARQTNDADERAELYASVWEDWAENVPYLWLYHSSWILAAVDEVRGVEDFTLPNGDPAAGFVWGSLFLTEVWTSPE